MDETGVLPRNTTTAKNNQPNGKYDYYYDYDPVPSYHETYRDYDYHAKSPIDLHMQPTTPHDFLPSENDHDLQLVGGGVGRSRRDGLGGRGDAGGAVGGGGSGGGGRIDNGRRMNEEMRELTQQDGRGGRGGAGGEDGGGSAGGEVLEGPKRWFSLVILLLVLLVVIFVVVAIVILYLNCKYLSF